MPDKYHALAQYRFCLCFENELDTPGYITEKLFDCFFCGTVPIYLGASNIEDYVPKDCFIDMHEFADFGALRKRLESFDAREFRAAQEPGLALIASDSFRAWTPEGAFAEMVDNL